MPESSTPNGSADSSPQATPPTDPKPQESMSEFLDRMEREGVGKRATPEGGRAVIITGIQPPPQATPEAAPEPDPEPTPEEQEVLDMMTRMHGEECVKKFRHLILVQAHTVMGLGPEKPT